jgi:5-hydroxyisourate hydrolase
MFGWPEIVHPARYTLWPLVALLLVQRAASPTQEDKPLGHLSTHVLDTMHGCPAAGMQVQLQRMDGEQATLLKRFTLNADGRNEGGALLDATSMASGHYRLVFAVAPYFRSRGVVLPEPAFLDDVTVAFGMADASARYHVPLLVSPWSYSTYRGS